MTGDELKKLLLKMEILWENTSHESSDDVDAYGFICVNSLLLRVTAFELREGIQNQIRKDKRAKLKFQKLMRSLNNIAMVLDFDLPEYKDREFIESVLRKLAEIEKDIDVVRQYQ